MMAQAAIVAGLPVVRLGAGWLACDGALVSRVTYAALFAAIGVVYGVGDGATTFKLPDLRGEFLRGVDGGRGVDVGRVLGGFQLDQLQDHAHLVFVNYPGGTPATIHAGPGYMEGGGAYTTGAKNARIGGETRPRNVALLACISTGA